MTRDATGLTPLGALVRIGAAIVLVLATFNPSPWSFLRWAFAGIEQFTPVKAIVGLLLLTAWVVYVRAALQSLGMVGVGLLSALIAACVWLAADQGWLEFGNTSALHWIGLVGVGLILGVGLSWSHFRRRLTGQVDVDDGPG
jgi:hypothetical protein